MKRHWTTLSIVAGVAVVAMALVAVASAAPAAQTAAPTQARTADCGVCGALSANPEALKEWQALRTVWQEARQEWFEKSDSDRRSDEAQAALRQLRERHWADMRALLERYDIEVPDGAGPGGRAGQGRGLMGGGGCGGQGAGAMMGGACL
jgi:hypothetical protein